MGKNGKNTTPPKYAIFAMQDIKAPSNLPTISDILKFFTKRIKS